MDSASRWGATIPTNRDNRAISEGGREPLGQLDGLVWNFRPSWRPIVQFGRRGSSSTSFKRAAVVREKKRRRIPSDRTKTVPGPSLHHRRGDGGVRAVCVISPSIIRYFLCHPHTGRWGCRGGSHAPTLFSFRIVSNRLLPDSLATP